MKLVLLALAAEIAIFTAISPNFLTTGNLFEITRLSVELGLLAIALTPILVSGGIDLSVGSMMGLAASIFGIVAIDWHQPIAIAAAAALLAGLAGGMLNAFAVAWLGLPSLIVTLGSFSMFRGIAEGLTHGSASYNGFSPAFLFLGQGYVGGVVPAQLPLFLLVLAAYWLLLHRSFVGRALYAIGFSAPGARHAGLPVARRVGLVYVLSGITASLAGIVYVAHLGQAKSNAGTGFELDAITAVVLGGTSVFGGRGTLFGTVLGLCALSTLQNGLRLAALPSELTGLLTGALLVTTIALDRVRSRSRSGVDQVSIGSRSDADQVGLDMKNSQVAVLCATVLAGALIVSGTNVWLVRSLAPLMRPADVGPPAAPARRLTIAMMPKAKGDPYFVSCRAGAEEARASWASI